MGDDCTFLLVNITRGKTTKNIPCKREDREGSAFKHYHFLLIKETNDCGFADHFAVEDKYTFLEL